ncbi:MAG: ribosome maturation factor RimM [Syntrophales bacterium]|nr:ribosome maturation factor RimM [Syntrophales bacterium]
MPLRRKSKSVQFWRLLNSALKKLFEIGRIAKPHGLKGVVKVTSFLEAPQEVLQEGDSVFLRRGGKEMGPFRLQKHSVMGKALLLKFEGLDSREAVEELVGTLVLLPVEKLRALPDGEYYWQELLGMEVYTERGEYVGSITSIIPCRAHDVYVCKHGVREVLLPAVGDVILKVDRQKRKMVVRLLEGL